MRFISSVISCLFLFCSCNYKDESDKIYPPYKLITTFSEKIKPETGLTLSAYGINFFLPKNYRYINGIGNFHVSYSLIKVKDDVVTLKEARELLVSLVESFLQEINSDPEVIPDLDVYPFTSDLLDIFIHVCDEIKVDLGQGVAAIYFTNGKITYERYDIYEYTGYFHTTRGGYFKIHEESYVEALDIVKKQSENPPI